MTGEELKALREKLGLSQTALAEKLFITRDAVSKLESGKNVMGRQTKALAAQLKPALPDDLRVVAKE